MAAVVGVESVRVTVREMVLIGETAVMVVPTAIPFPETTWPCLKPKSAAPVGTDKII